MTSDAQEDAHISAAKSSEQLRAGLAATCQDGSHWCCKDDFLKLTSLSHEQLQGQLKKWWGSPDMWLDMLATEIARALGQRVGIERELGESWAKAVDVWTDAAYVQATAALSCPPQRPMISAKAAPLATRVLSGLCDPTSRTPMKPNRLCLDKVVDMQCEKCGEPFSQRLTECPSCFPRFSPVAPPSSKQSSSETKQVEWQKCTSSPLENIAWPQATDVIWCHGGSGGLVLIKVPTGVVGAKACRPEELFAQRLATALGVRTADLRILAPGDEERSRCCSGVQSVAPSTGDDGWLQVRKILGATYLSLVEFVDGWGMMGMQAHTHLLHNRAIAPPWFELGRLMAFDMLINNFDRVPLAWSNEGNLRNVMVGSSLGSAVGIDQTVNPITHPEGLRAYLERVRRAVSEARDGEARAFAAVKEAIYANTAVELSAEELRTMREGCNDFATELVRQARAGELTQVLETISDEVSSAFADMSPRSPAVGTSSSVQKLMQSCSHLAEEVARALSESMG